MGKYRIMIVDDDDDARKVLAIALGDRYEVVEACDGLDALSKLDLYEPDLAILDIMMPLMDGYQLCEAIRKHERYHTMQVIFLSAYGTKEKIKQSYAAGANLFITKPVDPMRVLKNIDFTIEHDPPPLRRKLHTLEQIAATLKGEAREAAGKVASAASAGASGTGKPVKPRVLLVDDDPETLAMLDIALQADYEVTTAGDGIEAIERMIEYDPDLMVIDIMMPKMNGYQLIQSIRRNESLRDLPLIVLSAKASPKDKAYAQRLGANDFLSKPFRLDELTGALESVRNSPTFAIRPKKLSIIEIKERITRARKAVKPAKETNYRN